jgi:hypothetical protein
MQSPQEFTPKSTSLCNRLIILMVYPRGVDSSSGAYTQVDSPLARPGTRFVNRRVDRRLQNLAITPFVSPGCQHDASTLYFMK